MSTINRIKKNHLSSLLEYLSKIPLQLFVTIASVLVTLLAAYVSYRIVPIADRLTSVEARAASTESIIQYNERTYIPIINTTGQKIDDLSNQITNLQKQERDDTQLILSKMLK